MAIKKNRMNNVEERNQRIAEMDLEELKRYLCLKNYQKPEKCIDCPGISTCTAGQRAVVLLDKRAAEKDDSQMQKEDTMRIKYISVCSNKTMIDFLAERDGITRSAALTKIKYWAKKFPDITDQYDVYERLNSEKRPRIGGDNNLSTAEKKRIAIEKYKDAKKQQNPVDYLMNKYGWTRKQAQKNFSQWEKRYSGEIMETTDDQNKPNDGDEVSVSEFLKEFDAIDVEQKPVIVEQSIDKEPKSAKADFIGELKAKYAELEDERTRIRGQIHELENRRLWINKAEAALSETAKIFGLKMETWMNT